MEEAYLSGKEVDKQHDRVAEYCARVVRRHAGVHGDDPWSLSEKQLFDATVALGLKLMAMIELGDDGGYLSEQEAPALLPTILYWDKLPKRRRAAMLAHELPHHILRVYVAPKLFRADSVICFDRDGVKEREKIARKAQRLLWG